MAWGLRFGAMLAILVTPAFAGDMGVTEQSARADCVCSLPEAAAPAAQTCPVVAVKLVCRAGEPTFFSGFVSRATDGPSWSPRAPQDRPNDIAAVD